MEQAKQYEYIDLGLPSGLKWAKCNVGAEKETDYGDYFMWGSTRPNTKTTCNWMKNPFNNGSDSCDEEYFNAHKSEWLDDNDNLKPEYDAARANMGGDWRMPTKDDFQELLDNTDSEWVHDYNGTGVGGRKFTSKTNGNSIFIPFSGERLDSSFYFQGTFGNVWSSSLDTAEPYFAWYLGFSEDRVYADYYESRDFGFVVRGVME